MKKFLIISVIVNSLAGIAFGQGFIRMEFSQPPVLSASAGTDTIACTGHPVVLGGHPSATGGDQNYYYLWTPADGLNDPTSSNPIATLTETRYYTLCVIDGGGCQAISHVNIYIDPCLGTNEQQLNQKIRVYPNPSDGVFTIDGLSSFKGQLQSIEVLNQLGQLVYSRYYEPGDPISDLVIDTQIKDPGYYFLKIKLSDKIFSQRLIIR